MSERKLATIRRISEVKGIEGADLIQAYRVDGWWVVSKKGEYEVGDLCIYLEVDSWVPTELAPFLSKGKEPREFNGVKGERLRTIKLKGQVSQGLLLPISFLPKFSDDFISLGAIYEEDLDWSSELGIQLYEPPSSTFERCGQARKGGFPWYIPKSDQERIQNIKDVTKDHWIKEGILFEVTEKLEGSSMTVYVNGEDEGVCSRNINLKKPEEGESNTFWMVTLRDDILTKLKSLNRNLAIQGELIGPGIQGNYYSLGHHQFWLYNIWDIDNQVWLGPKERGELCNQLGLNHAPILDLDTFTDVEDVLKKADGKSVINPSKLREGEVWKSYGHTYSFKAVSNQYLLQGGFH